MNDIRVEAIRSDAKVGADTCSLIDECYSDAELIAALDERTITTAQEAVRWARRVDRLDRERFNDIAATGEF